ncbi:LysM peptidoglycan-binding domain-containing protein [Limoniibacter endophyticus]|uniref:LysM domain-containing protein n=1 Tax=Limoniibacter endophyticus TaxID=1565040 RepID=A0A8J3GFQ9_9HYPH|nr:LysM peptidoglycan-binding domain-containing protein [Limoniibacter endophyticus]GHC68478.1 hypothetical protein GCM10010136_13230 [Limoniibacter endophyticus]
MTEEYPLDDFIQAVYAELEEITLLLCLYECEAGHEEKQTRFHVVEAGETLWGIAKTYYGKGSFYPELQAANPQLINTSRICPGQRLIIPTL